MKVIIKMMKKMEEAYIIGLMEAGKYNYFKIYYFIYLFLGMMASGKII